jgi:peptidoglycan hydrolase-like protein with peptidoglycan-binding domain
MQHVKQLASGALSMMLLATGGVASAEEPRQPVSGAQTSPRPDVERAVGRDPSPGAELPGSPLKLDSLDAAQLSSLQTRLQQLGFYRGTVDGVPGNGTRSALVQFFRSQAELASRGMLTDSTAQMLGVTGHPQRGPAVTHGQSTGMPPNTGARAGGATRPVNTNPGGTGSSRPATMPHPQPSTP